MHVCCGETRFNRHSAYPSLPADIDTVVNAKLLRLLHCMFSLPSDESNSTQNSVLLSNACIIMQRIMNYENKYINFTTANVISRFQVRRLLRSHAFFFFLVSSYAHNSNE